MALQTSGAISLNDIHVEAGGTSGTQASINDSDIRALIGKASGATMSFDEWYGASANTVITVTQGSSGTAYGFDSGLFGSISPTTYNGASILYLAHYVVTIKGNSSYYFQIEMAGNRVQSFFASVEETSLGNKTSSSASHSYNSGSNSTFWIWTLSSSPSNWDGSGNLSVTIE